MTKQQIAYIRECLSMRKRHLQEKYCETPTMPPEVEAAAALVKEWESSKYDKYHKIRKEIDAKIRTIEEQIILGGMSSDIAKVLATLDAWVPENA